MKQALGRFVVADPKVCHGRPTFRGTRILVDDVLNDVSRGLAWERSEEHTSELQSPC